MATWMFGDGETSKIADSRCLLHISRKDISHALEITQEIQLKERINVATTVISRYNTRDIEYY